MAVTPSTIYRAFLILLGALPQLSAEIGDAIDQPDLSWTSGDGVTHLRTLHSPDYVDGDALVFKRTGTTDRAWIETTIEGPAIVTFFWRIRNILGSGGLSFAIDGQTNSLWSSTSNWSEHRVDISESGSHTLRWTFWDSEYELSEDSIWLDAFTISRAPIITGQPHPVALRVGESAPLSVATLESIPVTYQWTINGQPIVNETSSTLEISNATLSDSGLYSVEVSNANGTSRSESVRVTVYENLGDSLEQSEWDWAVNGVKSWHPQTQDSFDGEDALEFLSLLPEHEYPPEPSATATLSTTVEGPGEISFYWKHQPSFHSQYQLHFEVNGSTAALAPRINTWTKLNHAIPTSGTHTLEWKLWLQGFSNTNLVAKLDNVRFERKPIIVEQPSDQLVTEGDPMSFGVSVVSATPITYQWRRDGIDLPGENASDLSIDSASLSDNGVYDVRISNAAFESQSASANGTVIEPIDEALNQSELDWDTNGSPNWFLSTQTTHDGSLALEGRDAPAKLATTVEGPVTVSFWWRSETSLDYAPFQFQIDGFWKPLTRNATGWVQETFLIPDSGPHALSWDYWPDAYQDNRLWLDELDLDYSPVVRHPPLDVSAAVGGETYFEVIVTSVSELSYQWLKNDGEIPGATGSTLTIAGVSEEDIADYSVRVSNAHGTVLTPSATIFLFDNFGESVEQPNLNWTLGNQRDWFLDTSAGLGNDDAAVFRTRKEADYISNFMETTLSGPFQISFWWRSTGEPGLHSELRIDQQRSRVAPSVEEGWVRENVTVDSEGEHTIQFATTSSGPVLSEFIIDRISLSYPPMIQSQPASLTVFTGETISLNVEAISPTPISYQWYRNGATIEGATESEFSISEATLADAGIYSVSLLNDDGVIHSENALVRVSTSYGEALDQESLSWEGSEESKWFTQPRESADSGIALSAEVVGWGQTAWIQTEIQGPATLSFDWKSEIERGQLLFLVNDEPRAWINNSTLDWQSRSIDIFDEGPITLRWQLSSDTDEGPQRAWLDSIRVSRTPVITRQPQSLLIGDNEAATLSVEAASETSITYQWNKDGSPLSGETGSSLGLNGALASAGKYDVILTNSEGDTPSRQVTVAPLSIINQGLDTNGLDWSTNNQGLIELQSSQTTDQIDAILLSPENELSIETTIEGPAIVEFDYRGEYINSGGIIGVLGEQTLPLEPNDFRWQSIRAQVNEVGPVTLKLTVYGYEDQAPTTRLYLDQLRVQKTPVISEQPSAALLSSGSPSELRVVAHSGTSLSYQWRKDGMPIIGANQSTYTIPDPSQADSGVYEVVVSNAVGDTLSDPAELLFESELLAALDMATGNLALGGSGSVSIDHYLSKIGRDSLRIEVAMGEVIWLEALSSRPSKVSFWWKRIDSCGSATIRSNNQYLGYNDPDRGTDWQFFEWKDTYDDENPFLWVFSPGYSCDAIFFLDGLDIQYDPIVSQPDELAGIPGETLRIDIDWRADFDGSIQWLRNGESIAGQNSPSLIIDPFQFGDKGIYEIAYTQDGETAYSEPIKVVAISNIGEPIEAAELVWTMGETGEWTYDTDESWDGQESLRMRSENQFETPWIETVIEGPALVSFKWLTEWNDCDRIFFYVNGEEQRSRSRRRQGESWKETGYLISEPGLHTLRWGWSDKDCEWRTTAWLDDLRISRGPVFAYHPKDTTLERGKSVSLSARTESSSDSIQWLRNGVPISGATGITLLVSSTGEYVAKATNAIGTNDSDVAIVTEIEPIGHLVEQASLSWETRSEDPWFANFDQYTQGDSSLSSPEQPLGGIATLTTYVQGPASLSFDYRITGPSQNARANIHVEGIQSYDLDDRISVLGTDWQTFGVTIEEPGLQKVTWSINVDKPRERFGVVTPYPVSPKLLVDNLKVSRQPLFVRSPQSVHVEANASIVINAHAISPEVYGPVQYQWYKNGSPIDQATTDSLFIPNADETATYWARATNSVGSANSSLASINVSDLPNSEIQIGALYLTRSSKNSWSAIRDEDDSTVFQTSLSPISGETIHSSFSSTVQGPGTLAFSWRKSFLGSTSLSFSMDGQQLALRAFTVPTRQRFYIPPGRHYLEWRLATDYQAVDAWVYELEFDQGTPHIELTGFPTTVLRGSTIVLIPDIISESPITSYQWYFNEVPIPGATGDTLTLNHIDQSQAGIYYLQATNENGTGESPRRRLEIWDKPLFAAGQNDLAFEFQGSGAWPLRTNSRGVSSISSPLLKSGQTSSINTLIEGPAHIEFEFAAFSQVPGTRFEFLVDGVIVFTQTTEGIGRLFHHEILQSGVHTLTWRVTNDNSEVDANPIQLSNLKISLAILTVYEEWAQLLFAGNALRSITHPQSDPDGDTKSNILEFLLGTDPLVADGSIDVHVVALDGQTHWHSKLDLIAWVNGVEFQFETSSDLREWIPVETAFTLEDDGQRATVELKTPAPISTKEARYVRIKLKYSTRDF